MENIYILWINVKFTTSTDEPTYFHLFSRLVLQISKAIFCRSVVDAIRPTCFKWHAWSTSVHCKIHQTYPPPPLLLSQYDTRQALQTFHRSNEADMYWLLYWFVYKSTVIISICTLEITNYSVFLLLFKQQTCWYNYPVSYRSCLHKVWFTIYEKGCSKTVL